MFRYLVAAVAAIYCSLLIFGDASRYPDVSRQSQDDVTGLSLAAFATTDIQPAIPETTSRISDSEAVEIALSAAESIRGNRERAPLLGMVTAAKAEAAEAETTEPETPEQFHYVSGNRVNLRAGPGTGNPVVGQLSLGDAAQVLSDQQGWYEIRTADGATSGWIYGKFLSDQKPG